MVKYIVYVERAKPCERSEVWIQAVSGSGRLGTHFRSPGETPEKNLRGYFITNSTSRSAHEERSASMRGHFISESIITPRKEDSYVAVNHNQTRAM